MDKLKVREYKRFVFIGIIVISLGITFSTTLKEGYPSLGPVFVALGGFFILIGLSKKRTLKESKDKEQN
jgi:drug/metabolite transporter superfamily protein YnfA